jgi:hypothetical protein
MQRDGGDAIFRQKDLHQFFQHYDVLAKRLDGSIGSGVGNGQQQYALFALSSARRLRSIRTVSSTTSCAHSTMKYSAPTVAHPKFPRKRAGSYAAELENPTSTWLSRNRIPSAED